AKRHFTALQVPHVAELPVLPIGRADNQRQAVAVAMPANLGATHCGGGQTVRFAGCRKGVSTSRTLGFIHHISPPNAANLPPKRAPNKVKRVRMPGNAKSPQTGG